MKPSITKLNFTGWEQIFPWANTSELGLFFMTFLHAIFDSTQPQLKVFFFPLVLYKNIKRKRINKQIQSLPSSHVFNRKAKTGKKKSNDLSKVKKASLWQSYSWSQAQDFTCGFQSWRIATYLTDLLLSPGYLHIYIHAATLQINKSPGLEWRHSGLMSERKAVPVMRKPAATGEMRLNPFSKSLWDTT